MKKFASQYAITLFLAFATTGCTFEPLQPTAELSVNRDSREIALMLEKQANTCWARDEDFFRHDATVIDARRSIDGAYLISAARFAGDIGLRKPFFVVEIADAGNGETSVSTTEGDYACSLTGYCFSLDFTGDVRKWLAGDLSCTEKKEPLI